MYASVLHLRFYLCEYTASVFIFIYVYLCLHFALATLLILIID